MGKYLHAERTSTQRKSPDASNTDSTADGLGKSRCGDWLKVHTRGIGWLVLRTVADLGDS